MTLMVKFCCYFQVTNKRRGHRKLNNIPEIKGLVTELGIQHRQSAPLPLTLVTRLHCFLIGEKGLWGWN